MIVSIAIVLAVAGAVVAGLCIVGFLADVRDAADRRSEVARVNRERRLAQARINRLTSAALQQMTEAAAPHRAPCQCVRCAGQGGQR